MIREEIVKQLQEAFPPSAREALKEAVTLAYGDARERYNEEIGCNSSTFGTDVYHFACHRLQERVGDMGDGAKVALRHPAFRLDVAGFEVGCHKVGDSETESIWRSFPQSEFAGETLVPPQLLLFGGEGKGRIGGIVIAHQGNPIHGLCALYLCLPDSVNERGRIDHWGHVEPLWRRDSEESAHTDIKVTLPPVEEVAAPTVRRKQEGGSSG